MTAETRVALNGGNLVMDTLGCARRRLTLWQTKSYVLPCPWIVLSRNCAVAVIRLQSKKRYVVA